MAKIPMNEKTIEDYMKRNKCNREEAIELINFDNDIEEGNSTEYDLTPEQEAYVSTLKRQVEHKSTKERKRAERKPNELKEAIIAELAELLENEATGQVYEDVVITNPNRMIHFKVGDKEFDLTLVEKRPKK